MLKVPFAGSGSSYLYGFFDQAWKEGMTKDEAEVLILLIAKLEATPMGLYLSSSSFRLLIHFLHHIKEGKFWMDHSANYKFKGGHNIGV